MFRASPLRLSKWNIKLLPASREALRESPTPVVFFNGIFFPSEAFCRGSTGGIAGHLSRSGYNVGFVDLSSESIPSSISLDDLINELHNTFITKLPAPPVAIAAHHNAVFMQKYLESWPVMALLMLNPLSPKRPRYKSTEKPFSNNMREMDNVQAVLQLLANEPVNLEPSPVPTRAIFSLLENNLIHSADAEDTREIHRLEPDDFIETECRDSSFNLIDSPLNIHIEEQINEFVKRY
jgi:hypothetical protein